MAGVIDEINNNHDIAVITREGSDPAVVMSLEDYNALIETLYLFSTPGMQEHCLMVSMNVKL